MDLFHEPFYTPDIFRESEEVFRWKGDSHLSVINVSDFCYSLSLYQLLFVVVHGIVCSVWSVYLIGVVCILCCVKLKVTVLCMLWEYAAT